MDRGVSIDKSGNSRSVGWQYGFLAAVALATLLHARQAPAGPAVTLRVGYQPYYAEAWAGVLVRSLQLYQGRLPPNDRVAFTVGTRGAGVLVSALRRGDIDLAYLGLEPALTVTQNLAKGEFRIIAVSSVSRRLCNVIVARPGAPPLDTPAAIAWLSGKRIAVPRGSCADLFLTSVLDRGHVRPARIFNQSIDMLAASLQSHAVDAVAVWEPNATELVRTTGAQRLIDGDAFGDAGAAFIVVRASLLQDHPRLISGWLAAERAAEVMLSNAGRDARSIDQIESQASDLPISVVHAAWWGEAGLAHRSSPPATFPFVVTPAVMQMLNSAAARMANHGWLAAPGLRPSSIADTTAREILARESPFATKRTRSGR